LSARFVGDDLANLDDAGAVLQSLPRRTSPLSVQLKIRMPSLDSRPSVSMRFATMMIADRVDGQSENVVDVRLRSADPANGAASPDAVRGKTRTLLSRSRRSFSCATSMRVSGCTIWSPS
jgi:hypothetical protein